MLLTADTSVVVASLASWHEHHDMVLDAIADVRVLPAHVLIETASVLTRLPGGLAQPMSVVADLLAEAFPEEPLTLSGQDHRALLDELASLGIRGGALYDGVVAVTARTHDATLLSLDTRAAATYQRLDAPVRWLSTG